MSTPTVLIIVDGVPLDLARQLHQARPDPDFGTPRPMVSLFPSVTHVAVPALLRGAGIDALPDGYESTWFDPARRVLHTQVEPPPGTAGLMGPAQSALSESLIYLAPRMAALGEIRWIDYSLRHRDHPLVAYVDATDAIGHFGGREALADSLSEIAMVLHEYRAWHLAHHGVRPHVVLTSDHGMAFAERYRHTTPADLRRMLHLAGFHEDPAHPDAAVLTPMGLVGGGVVYVPRERAVEAAEVVAEVPGVELAVASVPGGAELLAVRDGGLARARLEWRGDRYCYTPMSGDPLRYGGIIADSTWLPDAALRRATADHTYPDAAHRIRGGLHAIVRHPAPVLFSMEPGCAYGSPILQAGATALGGLRGTHGSLRAAQSLGFCTTTAPVSWPESVRPAEVLAPWRADLTQAAGTPHWRWMDGEWRRWRSWWSQLLST